MKPKIDRILINYIRISLILGVLSAVAISIIVYFEIDISVVVGICIFGILFLSIPGYLILPGLIHDDFKTGMVFTIDQMVYFAFVIFTLGVGPTLVYYIKFEPKVRAMLSKEKRTYDPKEG